MKSAAWYGAASKNQVMDPADRRFHRVARLPARCLVADTLRSSVGDRLAMPVGSLAVAPCILS